MSTHFILTLSDVAGLVILALILAVFVFGFIYYVIAGVAKTIWFKLFRRSK